MMEFNIETLADAQAVSRALEQFALRDVMPSSIVAEVDGEAVRMVVRDSSLGVQTATLIAEKIRAGVLVRSVSLLPISDPGA